MNKLFLLNPYRVERYWLEPNGLSGGQIYQIWHHPNSPFTAVYAANSNKIYLPGKYWFELDCETERLEFVGELPLRHRYERYGYSTHFGLVAWNRYEGLYRALIDDPGTTGPITSERLAEEYPFVPPDQRDAHHAAITAIRQANGDVITWLERSGTHIRRGGYRTSDGPQPTWAIEACLPRRLEGNAEAEELVVGLHNLRHVWFYDLPANGLARARESEPLNWLVKVKPTEK
jgi:hypothetical protein